ncbi:MAG: hypothetical protein WD623_02140 [Marinobacter sp.]|uniref:hypothetical protein n=1 Tax=Marinobacter sp. TaxID=50741 RepID=UPI00349FF62E
MPPQRELEDHQVCPFKTGDLMLNLSWQCPAFIMRALFGQGCKVISVDPIGIVTSTFNRYTPNPSGEDLAAVARRVEADILGAERRLACQDLKLSGNIRLTTTDTLFTGLLA